MPTIVSDVSGNRNDKIANAAKVLGRAPQRTLVFAKLYSGKRRKTVSELMTLTNLNQVRVLQETKKLVSEDLIHEVEGKTNQKTFEKIDFYNLHKAKILKLAKDRRKLEKFPTKINPTLNGVGFGKTDRLVVSKKLFSVAELTIDDFDSFKKVKRIKTSGIDISGMSETTFKNGVKKIIGENGVFKDWGGEVNDLLSTKLVYKGKRISAAFAFKGPGKKGKLTPGGMGKNGDQIQRLFLSPAEVFVIQYWDQIDQSVMVQMQTFAKMKSIMDGGKKIFYLLIDGQETKRIVEAYSSFFK